MQRNRAVGTRALTAGVALAVVAVPAAFMATVLPQAEAPSTLDSAVVTNAYKTMVLETGATDRVFIDSNGNGTYDAATSTTPAEPLQGLAGRKSDCLLTSSPSATLLTFTGEYVGNKGRVAPNVASFSGDSIGIAEKQTGTSCAQVDSSSQEVLTLGLAPGLKGSTFPVLIRSGKLDVELKQGARVLATAYKGLKADGVTREPVAYFDLAGLGTSEDPLVTTTLPYLTYRPAACGSADNGPDSAAGDNCLWAFSTTDAVGAPVVFDTLDLKAAAGSFSLEGGSDWGDPARWPSPTAYRSTFDLVEIADGDLNCKASVTLSDANGGVTPEVTVTRLKNAATESCTKIPYSFSNGTQKAEFLKPLDADASAQFVLDFVWTVPADTNWQDTEATAARLRTVVDFDSAGTLDTETEIPWCPDVVTETIPVTDESGATSPKTIGYVKDVATNADAVDQAVGYPGTAGTPADTKQFACIVSQAPVLVDGTDAANDGPATEEDKLTITEQIYVYGDVFLRKP